VDRPIGSQLPFSIPSGWMAGDMEFVGPRNNRNDTQSPPVIEIFSATRPSWSHLHLWNDTPGAFAERP